MRTPPVNPLRTRDDLVRAFTDLEGALLARWSPDAAGPEVGGHRAWYGVQAGRLEAVARYLWGLIPFTVGGGQGNAGWTHVLDAVVHGTDPDHPHYWGPAGDNDQRSVEMAALGLALRLVPDRIWTPLSRGQQNRLATWMGAMVGRGLVASNWQFFRLLVTMGLRHVDRAPADADADARDADAIAKIDGYYVGDGWYADGGGGQRDYYIPMAFHFYGLMLAQFATGGPVVARADEWKERAHRFGQDYTYWFGHDGAALAFGRSLAYRFAQGAFWAGCGVANVTPIPMPELRGQLLRHLRWWWRQPMLTSDGLLSLGYSYPNHNMLEPYNASGSPYWAFKGFAALALKPDHPFWQGEEPTTQPAARDSAGSITIQPATAATTADRSVQPHPGFLISREAGTGHVVALGAGQWHPGWPLRHRDAKYAKLVYSTYFGPTVGANHEWLAGAGIDGTIAVMPGTSVRTDGALWQCRGITTNPRVAGDHVVSDWASVPGLTVRSWLVPTGAAGWHVRLHRVEATGPIQFAEGGFALLDPAIEKRVPRGVLVRGDGASGLSGLLALDVGGPERSADLNDVEPNSSLYHSRVKTPVLLASLPAGTHWLATAVLGAAPGSPARWDAPPTVTLDAGRSMRVEDGTGVRVEIALG